MQGRTLICLLSLHALVLFGGEPMVTTSPDGKLEIALTCNEKGQLSYTFRAEGTELIKASRAGYDLGVLSGTTRSSENTLWKPIWGKRATVPDQYNELTLDMKSYQMVVRAYNDGVAFRTLGAGSGAVEFNFAGDYTAWYYNGEYHNIGPEKLSASTGRRLPVMTIQVNNTCYLAVHEAFLEKGEPLVLGSKKGETKFFAASKPTESWKVILFGRSPGALIDSHLIELLNPPPAADMDFSWVKPSVAVWDWRINGAKVPGFDYKMSYPSWICMVDFAAANKIGYLVLDADWYGKEHEKESNPTVGGYAGDARKLIQYAKDKGVGVWLYLNDVGGRNYPIALTLKTYASWGAAGVKYGFMKGSPQEKNAWTQQITALCATNKLLCNFHDGPVHPYGQMRTWPNAVTREFCHAQLDAHRVFEPKTFVTSVFVNMVAGPLDMNNGLADLTQAGRVDCPKKVPSTLAGEGARTLIVFSGATVIPDIPEHYRKHPEILEFIAAQQMPWQESKTLSGVIGQHIVMARQAKEGAWLIGAATNEDARELDIPLGFLGAGDFDAMVIEDGADSDYRTQRESYTVSRKVVKATDLLHVKLAPGGGACVLLKKR